MEIAAGIGEGEISYLTAERRGAEERGLSIYWGRAGVERGRGRPTLHFAMRSLPVPRTPSNVDRAEEGARRKRVTLVLCGLS